MTRLKTQYIATLDISLTDRHEDVEIPQQVEIVINHPLMPHGGEFVIFLDRAQAGLLAQTLMDLAQQLAPKPTKAETQWWADYDSDEEVP